MIFVEQWLGDQIDLYEQYKWSWAYWAFREWAREVSQTESSKVSSDGTVSTKKKTVTENSDGTVTKTEESKTTKP